MERGNVPTESLTGGQDGGNEAVRAAARGHAAGWIYPISNHDGSGWWYPRTPRVCDQGYVPEHSGVRRAVGCAGNSCTGSTTRPLLEVAAE